MRLVFQAVVLAAVVALSLRRGVFLVAALLRSRPPPPPGRLPAVTVLVPARNEQAVAERLLGALAGLDYPADRLAFVLVCDGCSDETPALFRAWAGRRTDARVLELPQHQGKPAALNAGLRLTETGIVAVVDADLAPRPGFLRELVPLFFDDRVAAVAGFLKPANADANIVTRYAAATTWVHQLVTSAGTDRLGLNPPTLGAAAFRREALDQIGGFPLVPVGEDVATSARLTRWGWRTRFTAAAVADNTLVSNLGDFWHQHIRWARSVFQVSRADRPPRSASLAQRLETRAASIGYADRLVFLVAAAGAAAGTLPLWMPLLYLAVPGLELVAALHLAGLGRRLPRFLVAAVLCFGVDLVASVAAVVVHVTRRPFRWHDRRRVPAGEDTRR